MLKNGQIWDFRHFYASLPPHKRPENKNEDIFRSMPPRYIPNDARKPNRISSVTLDNQTGRPGNAEILDNLGLYGSLYPLKRPRK